MKGKKIQMPVFGKGRSRGSPNPREQKRALALQSKMDKEVYRTNQSTERLFAPRKSYFYEETPMVDIRKMFSGVFGQKGKLNAKNDFIIERFRQQGRPVVVLDWGCGKGATIQELAEEYGNKVQAYGYGKDSYPEWQKANNAKLIHAPKEDLHRYFKDGSIDFIYSRLGLRHIGHFEQFDSALMPHLRQLFRKLSPGGKIVFDLQSGEEFGETLREMRKEFEGKARIQMEPLYGIYDESLHDYTGPVKVYITKEAKVKTQLKK